MSTLRDWQRVKNQAALTTSNLVSQNARVVQTTPSLPARANLFNVMAHPSISGLGTGLPSAASSGAIYPLSPLSPLPSMTIPPISPKSMKFLQSRVRFLSSLIDEIDRILSYMNDQIAENTKQINYFSNLVSAASSVQGINFVYTDGIAHIRSIGGRGRSDDLLNLIGNTVLSLRQLKLSLIQEKQSIEADIARSNQLSSQNRT